MEIDFSRRMFWQLRLETACPRDCLANLFSIICGHTGRNRHNLKPMENLSYFNR